MHLLRALPNAGKYLEYSIEGLTGRQLDGDQLFVERPYDVVDGKVEVTNAPGWGIEVNPTFLQATTYAVTERD